MTEEAAKSQGLFIPNWWLALLLIPLMGGVLWVVMSLTTIQATQQAMRDTLEFRLKEMEIQAKLNDEHLRQIENRLARIEGKKNLKAPLEDQ